MSNPALLVLTPRKSLIPLHDFLGAWFIGLIISAVIFGITCLQAYLYFTKHCTPDSVFFKSFVAFLMVLDTLHLALLSESYYGVTVTNFGDYDELGIAPWGLLAQILVGVVMSTLVQLFYAYRIFVLSKKKPFMPILIAICSLAELALGIAYMHNAVKIKFFKDGASNVPFSTAALSLEVICDVLIAGSMVYYLLRNKTAFAKTNRAINMLVSYAVNSGLLNMMFAICGLVTWLTSTLTLIYAPFFFILVRLYGCSFLSILNSRDKVLDQLYPNASDHAMVSIPSYNSNGRSRNGEEPTKISSAGAFSHGTVLKEDAHF
ncbi:hypothetical protein C8J57DRAFT_1708909 [Mycena rebaudengoi]|nr:hypothetical protein C8J57DRAFT_1708909 [Mycena rebaudengoi]